MKLNRLIEEFETWDISSISKHSHMISTKDKGGVYPPYVPFVGDLFEEFKIFVYATAQNFSIGTSYLEGKSSLDKVKRLYKDISIAPYPVLLGVVGIFIFARHDKIIESFSDIEKHICITNYYKFSLNNGKSDINPNDTDKFNNSKDYWILNDQLSLRELEILQPKSIISFKGRHNNQLRKNGFHSIEISDPAFILRGGWGHFNQNGSYHKTAEKVNSVEARELSKMYSKQVGGEYKAKNKIDSVEQYFLKFYHDWSL